jgi:hypothetical protein
MDTNLTVQLFFFTLAVTVALEAYKERERKVARIVLWAVVAAFGAMGFVWPSLDKGIPKVSTALGTLVSNTLTWFVLLVAIYFILRPFWAVTKIDAGDLEAVSANAEIEMLTKDAFAIEMERSDGRMATVAEKCAERAKEADQTATATERRFEIIDALALKSGENVDKLFELVSKHISESNEEIRALGARITRLGDQHDDIRESLLAIYERERMSAFSADIEEVAHRLTKAVADGKKLDDGIWQQWISDELQFRRCIGKWCGFAQRYVRQPEQTIWHLDNDLYEGDWSVSHEQFVTPTDIHKFKVFRIAYRHWQEMRGTVENNTRRVAFEGASMPVIEQEAG